MTANLTEEEFSKHTGTSFTTSAGEREVALTLVKVKGYLPQENEQGGLERFSIFLDGPGDIRLPQMTYQLRHPDMGEFDLFLVPISGDEKGFRYEAVFNYFKK